MDIAIVILQNEQKKLEKALRLEKLMTSDMHRATDTMFNIAQIKRAIKLLKAKQLIAVRNLINQQW